MKRLFFLLLFLILCCLVFLSAAIWFYLPVGTNFSIAVDTKQFVVNRGDDLKSISYRLYQNKLTKHSYSFFIYAYLTGKSKDIKAGTFQLSPFDNLSVLLSKLIAGGSADYWLKIIPGQRVEEINRAYPNLGLSPTTEGAYFPDSYLIPNHYDLIQTENVIYKHREEKTIEAKQNATNLAMSEADIFILASLLEREARSLESKKMVAGILLNRLSLGMPLQLDATVQYARDTKKDPPKYWLPISKSDLSINSPFNTYLNPGLPPGPICNPGFDSIYAAYHPIESDYIYYITGNDNQMHYAKTLDEHNTNVAKYLR